MAPPRLAWALALSLLIACAAAAAPAARAPWLDAAAAAGAGATSAALQGGAAPAAAAAASQGAAGLAGKPYFCGGLDCPDFDVLETSGDVQLRRYHAARYVVTTVEAESLLAAQLEGTKRLLSYLAGSNEDGARLLPPTVPLETLLFPADEGSETVKGRFCIGLYLPECAQDDPPRPSDRRVRVVCARTTDWFVLRIRTSLIDKRAVIHRAWDFIRELEHQRGRCAVNRHVVSFGVYDLPVPFIKAHGVAPPPPPAPPRPPLLRAPGPWDCGSRGRGDSCGCPPACCQPSPSPARPHALPRLHTAPCLPLTATLTHPPLRRPGAPMHTTPGACPTARVL
ncbi:MAG: regulatory factor, effector binding domain-containing protein [Monoraphidium minutum]|nr:MAG: regulatory factor, effector binding domain-containing protein [Monoraphidium minutum]